MSRPLSSRARRAVLAQETAEAFIILLTITHPGLAEPIRVCGDGADTMSRGNRFISYPFTIELPPDRDDQIPSSRLIIDNVERTLVETLRTIAAPPQVRLEIVLASQPDVLEAGPFDFTLASADYDASTIEGELTYEAILDEPFPADAFTPGNFPGLFS